MDKVNITEAFSPDHSLLESENHWPGKRSIDQACQGEGRAQLAQAR